MTTPTEPQTVASARLDVTAALHAESSAILACDWNGTLVDDAGRAWLSTVAVLRPRGLELPTYETFLADFQLPLSALFAFFGIKADELQVAENEWNQEMHRQPAPVLMPGVESMIDSMNDLGVLIGVVSAAAESVVRDDAENLDIASRLGFVIGSATRKRDVLAALAEGTARPIAYVGDTEHDIEAANAAGVESIGFTGGYRTREALVNAGATHVVSQLAEVGPIMERLRIRSSVLDRL